MSTNLLNDSLGTLSDLMAPEDDGDGQGQGVPLRVLLDKVQPDPDQPRKTFTEGSLKEMAASIEEHGVIQPIKVNLPNEDGVYIISHGERRWRASQLAKGVDDIPVFVEGGGDIFAQIIENIQREDLPPMDIAHCINQLIDAGFKAKEIARKFGKPESYVTLHKALPKLPPFILALYADDIVTSPRMLVDLQRAAGLDEEATKKFCGRTSIKGGATKKEVDAFLADLKKTKTLAKNGDNETAAEEGGSATSGVDSTGQETENTNSAPASSSRAQPSKSPDNRLGRVLVRVGNGEKTGSLVLNKGSKGDSVWVDFGGSEALFEMAELSIVGIEMTK